MNELKITLRKLVMGRFRVVYHERLLCIPRKYSFQVAWDIPWYAMTTKCITILYRAVEYTVPNTINATYAQHMMGRLSVKKKQNAKVSKRLYLSRGVVFKYKHEKFYTLKTLFVMECNQLFCSYNRM